MSVPSLPDVAASWDAAASQPGYQAAIHPTGIDPGAYAESGRAAAAEVARLVEFYVPIMGAITGEVPQIYGLFEFGVGDGRVARWLADQHVMIGADASPVMLERLADTAPTVTPTLWDGLSVPVGLLSPDGNRWIDCAYSVTVFIHLTPGDGRKVLANLAAAVRPGGVLLVDIPLYEKPRTRMGWSDVTVWTPKMLARACEELHLTPLEVHSNPGEFSFDNIGENHTRFQVLRVER